MYGSLAILLRVACIGMADCISSFIAHIFILLTQNGRVVYHKYIKHTNFGLACDIAAIVQLSHVIHHRCLVELGVLQNTMRICQS